jgi:hypothetical protein
MAMEKRFEKAAAVKLAAIIALLFGSHSDAATMTEGTLRAWNTQVQQTKAALLQTPVDPASFLSSDRHSGELQPVEYQDGLSIHSPRGSGIPVPSGLVHHWIGTVFIPNANVAELLSAVQDYNKYSTFYKPGVVESKLLSDNGEDFTYQLKFVQKGFGVKAGLIGQFRSTYRALTPEIGYSVTESTALTELADPETPQEHPLSFSESHGYVERVFTIMRYRQVGNGIYVQVEALTLSRGVPAAVRWMVAPLIERFSHRTMAETLGRVKASVQISTVQEAGRAESTGAVNAAQ